MLYICDTYFTVCILNRSYNLYKESTRIHLNGDTRRLLLLYELQIVSYFLTNIYLNLVKWKAFRCALICLWKERNVNFFVFMGNWHLFSNWMDWNVIFTIGIHFIRTYFSSNFLHWFTKSLITTARADVNRLITTILSAGFSITHVSMVKWNW